MADLSRIPTADLEALQQGDISKVSTDTLLFIQKQGDPISGVADQQQAPQAPGLGDKLGQRWKNIGQAFTGQIPGAGPQEPQKPTVGNVALRTAEVPLRVGGQMTGAVGDVLGAAAEAVIPDKAKETIKEGARYVLDSPLGRVGISAAKKGKEYYDLFKKSYPNVAARKILEQFGEIHETMQGIVLDYIHPEVPKTNALRDELEHFINTVRNNTPAAVSSSDGRRAIMVAGKIAEEIAANAALLE